MARCRPVWDELCSKIVGPILATATYEFWRALCRSLSWRMPLVTFRIDSLDVRGLFRLAEATLSFTDAGYVAFEFQ